MEKLASKQYLIQEWSNLQTFRQHTKKMLLSSLLFLPVSSGVQQGAGSSATPSARVKQHQREKQTVLTLFPTGYLCHICLQITALSAQFSLSCFYSDEERRFMYRIN